MTGWRARAATAMVAATAVAATAGPGMTTASRLQRAVPTPDAPSVRHMTIPTLRWPGYTGTLGVLGGRIVVGDDAGTKRCRIVTLQPETLARLSSALTACDNPLLIGENVMPVESPGPLGSETGSVRIAVRNARTGAVHLGPVLMRYLNVTGGRPEWTYGGGYLWLYDVGLPRFRARVLRISRSTGRVVGAFDVPRMARALLAADLDGLWIAQSQESAWPPGTAKPAILSFLGARAAHLRTVGQRGDFVDWLVAAGHTLWAGVTVTVSHSPATEFETFPTPLSRPRTVRARSSPRTVIDLGMGPADGPPVVHVPGFGLVGPWPGWIGSVGEGTTQQQVIKIDPTTGRESDLVGFGTPLGTLQANIVYDGSLYLLIGAEGRRNATLYRVQLRGTSARRVKA